MMPGTMQSGWRTVVLSACLFLLTLAASGQKAASTTTITSNSQYLQLPGSVPLSSTVNPAQGTAGMPTGSVQFLYDGTNSLGTAPLTPIPSTEGFPLPPTTLNVGNGPYGIFTLAGAPGQSATLGILDWYTVAGPNVTYLPELTIYSGHGASLYQSAATYQITNSGLTGYSPGVNGYLVADFNHDGAPDVLLYGYSTTGIPGFAGNEFYVLPGNASGAFNPAAGVISADQSGVVCDCTYPSAAIATDDFNGDGYPDVAYAANGAYSNNLVGVALNGGAAAPASFKTFISAPAPVVPGDTFQTLEIASGHFTSSGHADLVVAGRLLNASGAVVDAGDTAVYLGNGDGTFGTPTVVSEGTNPISIQTADFRKTGISDVVVANQGADNAVASIVVLFNDGKGNLTVASTVNPPIAPAALAVADFNADGYPDILSTGVDGSLALLLNDGTGHFAAVTSLAGTTSVSSISASGDFNADGLPDIARTTTAPVSPNTNATAFVLINSASSEAALTTAPQTLPFGMHTLTASFPSDVNFNASTSNGVLITVTQTVPTITWPPPSTMQYGTPLGAAQLNATGSVPGSLTYSPPAGTILPPGTTRVTATLAPTDAFDYTGAQATQSINVVVGQATASASAPATVTAGQDSSLTLTVSPYPAAITATLTLSFTPDPPNTVGDPAVLFPNNSTTDVIQIPANNTTPIPAIDFSPGSTAGTITLTVKLSSGGTDITPTSLVPVAISVPAGPPSITSVTLQRNGHALTVDILGLSPTRDMTQAHFHFTAANGHTLRTTDFIVPLNVPFTNWYQSSPSDNFGTTFLYTQPFTLDADAGSVGAVTVTLSNSKGDSQPETAQ